MNSESAGQGLKFLLDKRFYASLIANFKDECHVVKPETTIMQQAHLYRINICNCSNCNTRICAESSKKRPISFEPPHEISNNVVF